MPKPRNEARLSPCEAFWQKHNGFLCEKPILPYEHSAKQTNIILTIATLLLLYIKLFSAVNHNLDNIFLFVFENVIGFFDF